MLKRLGRAAVGLAIWLAIAELLVRALGTTDADGQFSLFGRPLPPYAIPLGAIRESLAKYFASGASFVVYDPDTGWVPRPNGRSQDGLSRANAAGFRAERDYPTEPPAGVLRIALFGDSFTFGDESAFADTWGAFLEADLAARGVPAEVLNFGMGGYGMDQAYLRWQTLGRLYQPDVVVFGLQPENAMRNLNVFRPLYFSNTGTPLSKPRFVLQGDRLVLVNSPALPPNQVLPALENIGRHPLAPYESMVGQTYQRAWWKRSRLAALIAAVLNRLNAVREVANLGRQTDARALARRILERFAAEARTQGAAFLFAYLPPASEPLKLDEQTPWFESIRRDAERIAPVIDMGKDVRSLRDGDFHKGGHYTARLNRAVAAALVQPVLRAACADAVRRASLSACASLSRRASPDSHSRPAETPPSPT